MKIRTITVIAFLAYAALPALAQLATDMKLEDAGFKMKEANTPQKMARLESIPARMFVPHRKNGQLYYVYADPQCKCAFVGDTGAMQAYRDMVAQRRIQQPDNVSGGGVNLTQEMQYEMNDESGTDFDDIFHPGF
ncbi:MAG: hypothetical protein ABWY35_02625 [Pseudorhodoplanes sp.]